MKVLMICNTDGALFIFRGPLIRRLLGERHTVCSISSGKNYVGKLSGMGVDTTTIGFAGNSASIIGNGLLLWRLYRLIGAARPDVVHSFTHKPAIYGTLAARAAGVGRIFITITGLGTLFSYDDLKTRTLRALLLLQYRLALCFATKVFFQNPDDLNLFLEKKLIRPDKAVLTHGSGVDLAEFHLPAPEEAADCRQVLGRELGCNLDGKIVLVFPARAIKEKGVYDYYAAARSITAQSDRYLFLHLGLVDDNAKFGISRARLEELAHSSRVHYLGFKDNIKDYFMASDVVVLPSTYREGVPRSLIEALALDKYIITTDTPGCRETVRDGWNGAYCTAGDASDLAEKIMSVDRPLLDMCQGRSRELCESKFDVVRQIDLTLDCYRQEP